MASAIDGVNFSRTAQRTFHDAPYVITASGDAEKLSLDVEHAEDGRLWHGEFGARFIEEITQRTGNTKKFDVFVKMLLSALSQESDSVYLDVLTARDLEMLRRHANPQGPPTTTSVAGQSDKRYLILTYCAEFDKVHYPLPLPLERSEEDSLRTCVARLRAELADARRQISTLEVAGQGSSSSSTAPATPTAAQLRDDERTNALLRQNTELTDELRVARREIEQLRAELRLRPAAAAGGGHDAKPMQSRQHQAEVRALKEEARHKEQMLKREADQSARELRAERQKVEKLQVQVRRLEEQRAAAGRAPSATRGTSAERSRAASRTPSVERSRGPARPAPASRYGGPGYGGPGYAGPGYAGPGSRPSSVERPGRPASRASSAASSRERTPSPGAVRRAQPRPGSVGAGWRGDSPSAPRYGTRQTASPSTTTTSPYRRPSPNRRPSQGPVSRERTPSPARSQVASGSIYGSGGPPPPPSRRSALSLREKDRSGMAATTNSNASPVPMHVRLPKPGGPPARASGGAGYPGPAPFQAAGGLAVAGSSATSAASKEVSSREAAAGGIASAHQPGSLFGIAAGLGIASGISSSVSSAGTGAAGGGVLPASSGEEIETCDIDARLQALQSFLKQTKNI
eukprot:TRINITY_DN12242_c0_g1_i1.p1 TRINITY_DN12242_c0_g1~~TRINITY_DN12242_c0_g1_i1.p1  ORF type:complete len:631 (-),score=136.76 TRINITY_DN12242_c0_g1_i1:64-1956(-)